MADNRWYYTTNGQTYGPMSEEQLRQYASAGYLQPTDYVWCEGMSDWAPAGQVAGVFAEGGGVAVVPPLAPPAGPQRLGYAPVASSAGRFAGFWLRLVAALLDGLLLAAAGAIAGAFAGIVLYVIGARDKDLAQFSSNVVGIAIGWLYAAGLESSPYQATLGKMALGLRVTDLHGQRISFGRATGRHFAKILSVLTVFIGYIMAGFTQRKQGLHDMIAGCLVVRKN